MSKQVFCFILFFIGFNSLSAQTFEDLTAVQFRDKLNSTRDAVIIDLRTDEEVRMGKISNSLQIDFFKPGFEQEVKKLDKSKPYFIYCAAGGRSGETMELMKGLGFKTVYNLSVGINGWKNKNFPVVKPNGQ